MSLLTLDAKVNLISKQWWNTEKLSNGIEAAKFSISVLNDVAVRKLEIKEEGVLWKKIPSQPKNVCFALSVFGGTPSNNRPCVSARISWLIVKTFWLLVTSVP